MANLHIDDPDFIENACAAMFATGYHFPRFERVIPHDENEWQWRVMFGGVGVPHIRVYRPQLKEAVYAALAEWVRLKNA